MMENNERLLIIYQLLNFHDNDFQYNLIWVEFFLIVVMKKWILDVDIENHAAINKKYLQDILEL